MTSAAKDLAPDRTRLLAAGLPEQLRAAGISLAGPHEAHLDPALQEEGRTALNIGRLGADTARLVAAARRNGDGALVLAGDDTAAIGVVSGLEQAAGADAAIGVVWVDAHGDFNTPETSFSGILAGMPVAILAGLAGPLWRNAAGLATPVATEQHHPGRRARARREGRGAHPLHGRPGRPSD